ncbi:protein trapped in endoderm-1-like [Oratosquilla oratoria]|uniref:protein trapped in endoderm-1-like n=1 Tax=Oratosquilla oratoria TaxID=337810 RepID=UPI003F76A1FA
MNLSDLTTTLARTTAVASAVTGATSGEEGEEPVPEPKLWALLFSAGLAIVIAILGFFGNGLTILALPFARSLRNAATAFVVNLAVSEMLFCATILPASAAHLLYLAQGQQLFTKDSDKLCNAFVFLRYVTIQAELMSIAGIAVNRCVLIASPEKYPKVFSRHWTAVFICFIWGFSAFMMALPLFKLYGEFAYNELTDECDFADGDDRKARRFFLSVGFLLPCCIVVASYVYIFVKARQNASLIKQRSMNTSKTSLPKEKRSKSFRRWSVAGLRRHDIRIALTIGVIFVVFLICCFPVSFVHYYDEKGRYPTLLLLLHPLYWFQYCLNLFIYVLLNTQYRNAYVNFLKNWWPTFREMTVKWFSTTTSRSRQSSYRASPPTSRTPNRKKPIDQDVSISPEISNSPRSVARRVQPPIQTPETTDHSDILEQETQTTSKPGHTSDDPSLAENI